jgi:transcriptional regulator GlxA family with amidase domain
MNKYFILLSIIFLVTCSKREPKLNKDWYNVAFLITDGTYNTEFTAPYDIFQHTQYREGIKPMNVFSVSNKSDYITTFEGLKIVPDYNLLTDELPRIDILVVPSAEHHLDSDMDNIKLIEFIKQTDKNALYMTSHCDGAFMLAKSGILNGKISTTFPSDIKKYKETFLQLNVKDSVLFVHDGKYITSAGGAKSFEAALYLTEVMYGDTIAQKLAKGLVIDWDLKKLNYFKK